MDNEKKNNQVKIKIAKIFNIQDAQKAKEIEKLEKKAIKSSSDLRETASNFSFGNFDDEK